MSTQLHIDLAMIRKNELVGRLEERGLELRDDSALCSKYISNETDLDLDHIVQRMCEMKYLYDYCNMKRIKKQVYYKCASSNKYKANIENSISMEAEKIALTKYSGGKYPDIFPWEEEKISSPDKFQIVMGIYFLTILIIPVISHFISTTNYSFR